MICGKLLLLAAAAESAMSDVSEAVSEAVSSSESGTVSDIPTLGDAVDAIVENPKETLSALGEFFENMGKSIVGMLPKVIFAVVVLIIGIIITKLVLFGLSKGLGRSKLDLTVTKFTAQVVKIVLYTLLLTIVLSMLGIPSTSVVTVIGTAGVAIGLALQTALSNVAGGFLLMINKPFKIGDYITTNGVEGTVAQISILYTRLDSLTNQAIFIPNGMAVNATIINNNTNENRRLEMLFSISYNDDFDKAKEIIEDILNMHEKILHELPLLVVMKEHGSSAIVILVRAWCATNDYWDLYFELNEKVRAAFIENDIHIPFEQLDVHLKEK
ncbi:MAG: mechanosensitive ion channel family protein [Oscillospiraceae bacterium]|nr:mechanosensitive ion channel family protein [Oscillospiraceae bacterium]